MPLVQGVGEAGGIIDLQFDRKLIPHNFMVVAKSEGSVIKVSWSIPEPLDYPDWGLRIRIMRKTYEWPNAFNDPDAQLVTDEEYLPGSGAVDREIEQTGLVPGQIYYYSLYELGADQEWIMDAKYNRKAAYPYDRWGCAGYAFQSQPRGWQYDDSDTQDLQNFLAIFGALGDDIKTDCEHLLSLFYVDDIHVELLSLLEEKYSWPGWDFVGGIARRKELKNVVYFEKIRGRENAYAELLEQTCDWSAQVVEGWKYVMFSNGLYDSTTPDLSSPGAIADIADNLGLEGDVLKYTNAEYGRNSVGGLGIYLTETGATLEFSEYLLRRWCQVLRWAIGCWVTYSLTTYDISGIPTLRMVSELGD
jgi:hypothetical protein